MIEPVSRLDAAIRTFRAELSTGRTRQIALVNAARFHGLDIHEFARDMSSRAAAKRRTLTTRKTQVTR